MDNSLWITRGSHTPVLLREVLEAIGPRAGGTYVDGTFGAGGYSKAMACAADCRVVGFDRDPDAVSRAQSWIDDVPGIQLLHRPFGEMMSALAQRGINRVDGIVLDLGVSSFQIDQAERGFSFQRNGPLDMRMSRSGPDAADLVNELGETELADLIFHYGDERASRRIARAIVRARSLSRINDTATLARIIASAVPGKPGKIHPATKSFQALRIAVNDELGELERALEASETLLNDGGILAVVAFHSGEDRIVKRFLAGKQGRTAATSRHLPADRTLPRPVESFRPVARRPIRPQDDEMKSNPRARSARLRVAKRVRGDEDNDMPSAPSISIMSPRQDICRPAPALSARREAA